MSITRRGFLGSILVSCAAPAIVKTESLMIVRPLQIIVPPETRFGVYSSVSVDSLGRITATPSAEDQLNILSEENYRALAGLMSEILHQDLNRKSFVRSFLKS